jgi:ATP-dependent protease ClpP protease subunit
MIRTILALLVLLTAALTCMAETQDPPTPPQPPAPNVATYFVIPIKGGIGSDFTAALMETLLQQAKKLSPTVVVLEIDTGGGDIHDAERIINLIIANKNLRFVALVRRALSAGAAITLACKEIYLTDSAIIGGAVSYRLGDDGNPVQLPADVAEKFQSIWRAVCRKAAEHGDHSSLLAEAMVDPDFSLTIRKEGDKFIIERNGRGEVLKANKRILTLTAREAVSCGLAKGIVAEMDALGKQLSLSGWQVLGQRSIAGVNSGNTAKAESGPGYLYSVLFSKAVSLKLTEHLTSLQEQSAMAEWNAWLKKQSFQRRSVRWTLRLIEARDRRGMTIVRGHDDYGKSVAFPTSGKLTDILRDNLKSAQDRLEEAKKQLARYRSDRSLFKSSIPPVNEPMVKALQQEVSRVSRWQKQKPSQSKRTPPAQKSHRFLL